MLPWKGNAPGSAVTFWVAPITSRDENIVANQSKLGTLKYWNWANSKQYKGDTFLMEKGIRPGSNVIIAVTALFHRNHAKKFTVDILEWK